jgi:hypothetical protein
MFKNLKKRIFSLALLTTMFLSVGELSAAPKKFYTQKSYSAKTTIKKPYVKKAPYAGYGKPSKVNGQPKTKITSGHVKKTSKGYTYVNPYARSK